MVERDGGNVLQGGLGTAQIQLGLIVLIAQVARDRLHQTPLQTGGGKFGPLHRQIRPTVHRDAIVAKQVGESLGAAAALLYFRVHEIDKPHVSCRIDGHVNVVNEQNLVGRVDRSLGLVGEGTADVSQQSFVVFKGGICLLEDPWLPGASEDSVK